MTNPTQTGHCLCKAVTLNATAAVDELHACHCSMCRQWGGGPFLVTNCGTSVTFDGEDSIQRYASSDWAERGFCKHCGTHLFYRYVASDTYFIPAGLLSLDESVRMTSQIFIDEKPHYYDFANDTTNMTGAEVIAQFENG
ncbi:GFA family protein [Alteromonas ponticola]|uniref:GFA family protein n=1 Tax=Alteromonas ponticola TaxID=2720613 RepID=A0ABX1R2G2_9ALTE|nr:GFA family protein [Alteromonas ponticola]NMH60647.1 GFA family protein [Alteromonas ponticola]